MNITPELYGEMSRQASPKSNAKVNVSAAFLVGGAICVIGQLFMSMFEYYGLDKTEAGTWTSIILVGLSSICTGFGWYQKLAKHAGAGTMVPITGFANSVAAPCIEFQKEGQVFGIGVKVFTIAGPVILYGIFTSWALGLAYWVMKTVGWL